MQTYFVQRYSVQLPAPLPPFPARMSCLTPRPPYPRRTERKSGRALGTHSAAPLGICSLILPAYMQSCMQLKALCAMHAILSAHSAYDLRLCMSASLCELHVPWPSTLLPCVHGSTLSRACSAQSSPAQLSSQPCLLRLTHIPCLSATCLRHMYTSATCQPEPHVHVSHLPA